MIVVSSRYAALWFSLGILLGALLSAGAIFTAVRLFVR